jgi:hypothetical protein
MTEAQATTEADDAAHVAAVRRDALKGKRRLTSSVLAMEVVVVWLAIIVAIVQSSVPVVASAVVGGVLALGCLVIAARITKPWAYPAGTVLQILAFLSGIVVHTMFVVGAIFAALWWVALRMGNTAAARAEEFADWVAAGRPPRNQGDVSGPPS